VGCADGSARFPHERASFLNRRHFIPFRQHFPSVCDTVDSDAIRKTTVERFANALQFQRADF
jgi:hypothetical protein